MVVSNSVTNCRSYQCMQLKQQLLFITVTEAYTFFSRHKSERQGKQGPNAQTPSLQFSASQRVINNSFFSSLSHAFQYLSFLEAVTPTMEALQCASKCLHSFPIKTSVSTCSKIPQNRPAFKIHTSCISWVLLPCSSCMYVLHRKTYESEQQLKQVPSFSWEWGSLCNTLTPSAPSLLRNVETHPFQRTFTGYLLRELSNLHNHVNTSLPLLHIALFMSVDESSYGTTPGNKYIELSSRYIWNYN